jgi:hypothetical protein
MVQMALGPTRPSVQWVPGALSPGLLWQRHEADSLPVTSAEVKKTRIYTSIPLYIFMAQCLVKHKFKFTFLLGSTRMVGIIGTTTCW